MQWRKDLRDETRVTTVRHTLVRIDNAQCGLMCRRGGLLARAGGCPLGWRKRHRALARQRAGMLLLQERDQLFADFATQFKGVARIARARERPQFDRALLGVGDVEL